MADDLRLRNLTTGTDVAAANMALATDPAARTATWTIPGLSGGDLPEGNYLATLDAAGVQDAAAMQCRTITFLNSTSSPVMPPAMASECV